jgi:hypothetical protein
MNDVQLVKIRRFGERFWVEIIKECVGDTILGLVISELHTHYLKRGELICFLSDEILERDTWEPPINVENTLKLVKSEKEEDPLLKGLPRHTVFLNDLIK